MNDVVKNRLKEVVPVHELKDLDIDEIELDTRVAFNIIGYEPKNLSNAIHVAWEKSEATMLSDFIYDIWRFDS